MERHDYGDADDRHVDAESEVGEERWEGYVSPSWPKCKLHSWKTSYCVRSHSDLSHHCLYYRREGGRGREGHRIRTGLDV